MRPVGNGLLDRAVWGLNGANPSRVLSIVNTSGKSGTVTTLIALILASALMIYLMGWPGVVGVAIFVIYAWFSPPPKRTTVLGQAADAWRAGCGIIMLAVIALLLARLCGC